jgi:hypothetical protein
MTEDYHHLPPLLQIMLAFIGAGVIQLTAITDMESVTRIICQLIITGVTVYTLIKKRKKH